MRQLEEPMDTRFVTNDYEWISFSDQTAYAGVCNFKLTGLQNIQGIEFYYYPGKIRQGQLLANIISGDYKIPFHMPVDGWLVETNKQLLDSPGDLLANAKTCWLAKIVPVRYTAELLHTNEYFTKHNAHQTEQ